MGNGGKPAPFVDGVQKLSDMLVDLKQIDESEVMRGLEGTG
ncbi:hypothetical protein [Paraburkholderia sprentiae]|nr:hypothetical protein [Paraburkholderia sprentiae]